MAQDQLRKPQPIRGTRGGAFAYCGSHLSHAEPQFTPVYRSRHPRTPQGATKPFTAENSPDHLNYYHRFVKKRVVASQWFRSVDGALNTIAGYEAMNIIRKGQIRWLAKGDIVGQIGFIKRTFGIAA